ncbi:MAG TPA: SDR family NAD(P)-dependent oxidoreductase [bacterium]|nr:SDR family NAD(P)-dependent oxidoreductase [bacterium]
MDSEKLCVVTGTSAGIGQAVAELLLERNWQVVGIARREAALHDHRYTHVRLDLSDADAVQRYFTDDFATEFPARDFRRMGLVNNAALLEPVMPMHKLALPDLARAFIVNSVVPVWLMGFFVAHCGHTPLRIVNVSSGAAVNGRAGWAAYCSTKAALLMAGKVFLDEAEHTPPTLHRDAAVYSYEPGVVNTDMQTHIRGVTAEDFPSVQRFHEFHEQGKLSDPARPAHDIADFLERDHVPPFSEGKIGG